MSKSSRRSSTVSLTTPAPPLPPKSTGSPKWPSRLPKYVSGLFSVVQLLVGSAPGLCLYSWGHTLLHPVPLFPPVNHTAHKLWSVCQQSLQLKTSLLRSFCSIVLQKHRVLSGKIHYTLCARIQVDRTICTGFDLSDVAVGQDKAGLFRRRNVYGLRVCCTVREEYRGPLC